MSKFTPGPWRVDPQFPADIQSADGSLEIATTTGEAGLENDESVPGDEEQKANAKLIAAAPDILAAIVQLLSAINLQHPDAHEAVADAEADARAAIAKATA